MKPLEHLAAEIAAALGMDAAVGRAGLERWAELVREAIAAETARWLTEPQAMARSGRRGGFFRLRRAGWLADGYAKRIGRAWLYHEAVVPKSRRQASDDPRAQARRDAAA